MIRSRVRNVVVFCCAVMLATGLCGCESFVKKFRREKLEDEHKNQEVVVAPQEYAGSSLSSREQYQQFFLLWKAWQDELVDSLYEGASLKLQLEAVKQAIRNLEGMARLLDEESTKALTIKLGGLKELGQSLAWDSYGLKVEQYRQQAEQLRNQITREFAPARVKDALR